MSFCLILLAAGNSKRFGSKLPKPYNKIAGKTLIEYSLNKFKQINQIKKIILVINQKHKNLANEIKEAKISKIIGGKSRQDSTLKALTYLKKNYTFKNVLIHDAARPNFSMSLVKKIINKSKNSSVIPRMHIQDALKEKFDKKNILNLNRKNFFITQTPQSFRFKNIFNLHVTNKLSYMDDDMSLVENLNNVTFVEGEKRNFKITTKQDMSLLERFLNYNIKVGIGFDVHRLVPRRKLFLGGIKIKSDVGTLGHSDGDPVLHSITDAILGASGMGDIGELFSDKNKRFKNIRSTILLKEVINKIKSKGYFIRNLDINIICEKPKLKKYKKIISDNIAKICEISENQVNIKGKTAEKLGVIGKEQAIACEVITALTKYD